MSTNLLRLTCPKCATALSLQTLPASGRCKCPKCGAILTTDAATLPEVKPAVPKVLPAIKPAAPKAPPAIQKMPMPKAAPTRPAKAKPDDVVRAVKPVKKGNGLMLLLLGGGGLLVAGFFALMLVGGVIGLIVWKSSGKSSADPTIQPVAIVTETASTPQKEPQKEPPPSQPVNVPSDGSLAAEVLQRTKQATLLIKVKMGNGSEGSGSGFFEESSGLVVTNAHVVGMLDPTSPAPKQIDVVINSGLPNTKSVAGKLIVVDRTSDLALLDVQTEPSQAKLKVTMAKNLQETQRVYVCGFPLGEAANKNLTINPTAVSSLHRGNDGIVTKVQVNGGMDHGNSGGPVIDAQGNVIGVSFRGYEDSAVKFAIPAESVHALLEGRVSGISVNNEAIARGGQLYVPVSVSTLDPRHRITRIAFDYWIAPSDQPAPRPSDQQPNLANTTSPRRTVEAVYDAVQQVAKAELMLDRLPESNNRLWIQPVATNGTGKTAWLSGLAYEVDAPVEPKPAMLKAQFRQGDPVPVQLKSTARFKVSSDDEPFSLLQNLETTLSEQTTMLPPTGGAKMQLTVRKFATGVSKNNQAVTTTAAWKKATSQDIAGLALDHDADAQGNLKTKRVTFVKPVAAESKSLLEPIGKQLNQSFDIVSLPQPGNLMQPGQTWQARRELPTPLLLDDILNTLPLNMTYTYRGVRQHNGRTVAVVDLRANLLERIPGRRGGMTITLTGKVTGSVLVDPETGMVVRAKALTDTTLVARSRTDTIKINGTLDIRLQRGN